MKEESSYPVAMICVFAILLLTALLPGWKPLAVTLGWMVVMSLYDIFRALIKQ